MGAPASNAHGTRPRDLEESSRVENLISESSI